MPNTTVYNLDDEHWSANYSLPPEEAVIAAHAQFACKDWNTGDYQKKYGHLVQKGHWHYFCGDYAARITPS